MSKPKAAEQKVGVFLAPALYTKLKIQAAREKTSMSKMIAALVEAQYGAKRSVA